MLRPSKAADVFSFETLVFTYDAEQADGRMVLSYAQALDRVNGERKAHPGSTNIQPAMEIWAARKALETSETTAKKYPGIARYLWFGLR